MLTGCAVLSYMNISQFVSKELSKYHLCRCVRLELIVKIAVLLIIYCV